MENTHANESRYDEIAINLNQQIEPLVTTPLLFQRSDENPVSTRDRIAKTGTDARIEESVVNAQVRLALRPYGRKNRLRFRQFSVNSDSVNESRRGIRLIADPAPTQY